MPPRIRRQSEEEDLGLSVDAEDNSPGLLDGAFSRQVSPEMPPEPLHPCSPHSNVEDSFSKFSEQDSSAVMDSIYSSFGTWEARRSFTKLRQDLVHRQRMIEAVSRKHRRVLTTARIPGMRSGEEEPPRRKRVAASTVSKTEISDQRQSSASPAPELKTKLRGFKELPKAWKKRNLPRCKAEHCRSGSKVPIEVRSSSPRQTYLPEDVTIPLPSPMVEGRWENVKHSASFNGPNLEAIMVQRSLRKQIIRSLRLQPRMEAKELHDVLGDSQRWTPEVPSARWSSSERLRLLDLAGLDADLQEEVETVATPTSQGFHRPARRFTRPMKRQPDRSATVGPSTCQIPPLDLDCEGGVWSKLDRTEDESP